MCVYAKQIDEIGEAMVLSFLVTRNCKFFLPHSHMYTLTHTLILRPLVLGLTLERLVLKMLMVWTWHTGEEYV